ncbi:Membrane protein PTM1 [Golovinomyces cichoracearum]|uniref:Membrane protein PTM1 n=1 Tax=Golovinomyces cichoracearum TaxID=62708 RepID=A0A420J1E6_9PEZI|nr:Membrane protein PTM1 [Golovinomyces cichoracearum]
MPSWLYSVFLTLCSIAGAINVKLDQSSENRQICAGVYSRAAWGGAVDPHISINFTKNDTTKEPDPIVSLMIFEWNDYDLIGRQPTPESENKEYICDEETISLKYCNVNETGQFIMAPNATKLSKNLLFTEAIHLKDPGPPRNYSIKKTGYFCVGTSPYRPTDLSFEASVEFRNAYGQLPGSQIAKLPFYGGITIAYAVVGAFWAFLYVQHRHDILPVQNYITAILIFLVVEMLMTWGFYDFMNRNGSSIGSKILMMVVAVLNAGRNSFSFFLLLIVCMGYGVVKDSLGKTMIYVRWLAGAHFLFSLIYAVISLTITPESAGSVVLLVILPLAGTLTAFYVWTLNSLNHTMKDLSERKQTVKALMFRRLWWAILGSIMVIFGFFFFNSFSFASRGDPNFVPFHWKTRWFILDGWLNLVYLGDVIFIAYLWRPTENNRRFAMSDELAQDDEGFEIEDFGAEDDDDLESPNGHKHNDSRYDPAPNFASKSHGSHVDRGSLEGETMFAIGEDGDKWSDDETNDEHNGLVNKSGEVVR